MKISEQMKAQLKEMQAAAKALIENENAKLEDINAKKSEIETFKAKIAMQEQIEIDEAAAFENNLENNTATPMSPAADSKITLGEIVAKAVVGIASKEELQQIKNLMSEGVAEKGGVIVPPDVQTKIIELQRKKFDVRQYVSVEPTTVLKGSRVVETNEPQATGFASVDEGADIQELHEPELGEVEYAVRKYAGFIPITNELLADSPENILAYLLKWMAKNELNTYGYQVFNGSGVKAAQGIMTETAAGKLLESRTEKIEVAPDIKKFKNIINVKLDEVDTDKITLFTNAVGYDYIDGLEDNNGKGYLQEDATKASGYKFLGKEIVKVPTRFLADVFEDPNTYTPFIFGDLELLYTIYNRKQMEIESTKIGGVAWRQDKTEIKGVFRFDGRINGDIKSVYILLAKLN